MINELEDFVSTYEFRGKGPLSVALVLTDKVRERPFPLNPADYLTESGGQVRYLGGDAVRAILARHGLGRVLASEGGRTSRGSLSNMRDYVAFLNAQHERGVAIDWAVVEGFWISKVKEFFNAMPFKLKLDGAIGIRAVVRDLLQQALRRQQEQPGTRVLGTMMQHLVGAKLAWLDTPGLAHHHANQNDQGSGRTGDFNVGDTCIHVTSSPTEQLLLKCEQNLADNQRPVLITLSRSVAGAELLAENLHVAERIDILDFEQFLAANIHERGGFEHGSRQARLRELIGHYNAIVEQVEPDHSLKISLAD